MNAVRTYAGIGSRKSPPDILRLMTEAAAVLARRGYTLRTGGAEGADEAFREGAVEAGGVVELYLPWPGFNCHTRAAMERPTELAMQIAAEHHPAFGLKPSVRALMGRNVHQVLGADCNDPASFVLCWTPDGAVDKTTNKTGGTGMALSVAIAYSVPRFNLARADHRARVERMLTCW